MTSTADLGILLGGIAEHFERVAQEANGSGIGWGQFLDSPKTHSQVGPYGTCAGLISLTLAGRGQSPASREAVRLVANWWRDRHQSTYAAKRFSQTLRVALLYLSARISEVEEFVSIRQEVQDELFNRQLQWGGWGNWWLSRESYDQTPSVFTTSISIICALAFRDDYFPEGVAQSLRTTSETLWSRLESSSPLSSVERAAAVAAISVLRTNGLTPHPSRRIPNRFWRTAMQEKHGIYFFFYEHPPDSKGKSFGRDYFLIPPDFLIGLAGLQPAAEGFLKLRAAEIVEDIAGSPRQNGGIYRLDSRDHFSSLDQGWVSVILAQTIEIGRGGTKTPGVLSRLLYELAKEREGNFFTDVVAPIALLITLLTASALPGSDSVALKLSINVGTAVVAAFYGDDLLRRILPGKR